MEGDEEELATAKGEGKLEWTCEIGPSKQTVLVTEWQVSAPSDYQISGLETK
jgi:hypothetical protein